MLDALSIIKELDGIAAQPKQMLDRYLAAGRKVIGCFPIYTPEELVHAAGMIPMGLWGGQVSPAVAGQYAPIFTCSIMRSCLEFGMQGNYAGISAALMPMLCDTFRGISSAWRIGVPSIPLLAFIHPQNREDVGSREFLVGEYEQIKKKLELIGGREITEQALEASLKIYNNHHAVMREFAAVANDHLDLITPRVRHIVNKSSHFMDKSDHAIKVAQLISAVKEMPVHYWTGKKVILTGITGEPDQLLDIFAENNIAVVGDDLAQESRQFRTDIPPGNNAMERLAQQWFDRKACSVIHEVNSSRGDLIVELAKRYNADGIVVCLMKFCDVEEYDYPMIVQKAEAAGLPTLCVDIDQSMQDDEQARTRIQSFAEMI